MNNATLNKSAANTAVPAIKPVNSFASSTPQLLPTSEFYSRDIEYLADSVADAIRGNEYSIREIDRGVKIYSKSSYIKLLDYLHEKYQLEGCKVFILHLHKETPTEWITKELTELNYKIQNIHSITNRSIGNMFAMELNYSENINDIFNIKTLVNQSVNIVPQSHFNSVSSRSPLSEHKPTPTRDSPGNPSLLAITIIKHVQTYKRLQHPPVIWKLKARVLNTPHPEILHEQLLRKQYNSRYRAVIKTRRSSDITRKRHNTNNK